MWLVVEYDIESFLGMLACDCAGKKGINCQKYVRRPIEIAAVRAEVNKEYQVTLYVREKDEKNTLEVTVPAVTISMMS